MRILGIDPGVAATGIGVVEVGDNGIAPLYWGVIRPPKKEDLPSRLAFIYQEVEDVLRRFQPDVVSIEEVFLAKDPHAAIAMGQARGVVLAAVGNGESLLMEFSPSAVKRSVVGRGSASKEQLRYMVLRLLGLREDLRAQDAIDALAVALCGAFKLKDKEIAAPDER